MRVVPDNIEDDAFDHDFGPEGVTPVALLSMMQELDMDLSMPWVFNIDGLEYRTEEAFALRVYMPARLQRLAHISYAHL